MNRTGGKDDYKVFIDRNSVGGADLEFKIIYFELSVRHSSEHID
jgi:hypothetical protein